MFQPIPPLIVFTEPSHLTVTNCLCVETIAIRQKWKTNAMQ